MVLGLFSLISFFKRVFNSQKAYFSKKEILYLDIYLHQIYLSVFRGFGGPISNFTDFYQNKTQPNQLLAVLKPHLLKVNIPIQNMNIDYLDYSNSLVFFVIIRNTYRVLYWLSGKYFLSIDEVAMACAILEKLQQLLDSEKPDWRNFENLGVDAGNLGRLLNLKTTNMYRKDKSDITVTHLFENPNSKTMEIEDLLNYYLKE